MNKKLRKSLLSFLLIPVCSAGIAAPLAFNEKAAHIVEASTAGKTREQALAWARSQEGKGYDYDGFAGVQCTDIIQMYANELGQKLPAVGAAKYITCALPSGWKRYDNSKVPQAGDIFIYDSNKYGAYSAGHVGIILEVSSDGYTCIEYNWNNKLYGTIRKVSGQRSFSYIIRPDFPVAKPSSGKAVSPQTGYYILNTAVGNTFFGIAGNSTVNRANVRLWQPTGKGGQIFKVSKNSQNNGYNLINVNSGKYINTETQTPGRHNVIQYTGNGGNGQQWLFDDAGNGYVYIRNFFNYYLDVAGGINANGTNVGVFEFNGTNAQRWKMTKVSGKEKTKISAGDYVITSKIGGKVLDVSGGSKASGANVQIYTKNNSDAQTFTIGWDNNIGSNYIINKASNKYLDTKNSGGADAANTTGDARQSDKTLNKTQSWFFEDAGDGYFYIRNLWGYYLDVSNGVNADGTNVVVWTYHGEDNQKWKLTKKDYRTGVYYENGSWIYLKNGEHDKSFTGVAKSSKGNYIFIRNGVFDSSFTGVALSVNGNWVYVKDGRYNTSFTGVAVSTRGNKIFVKNGRFDNTFSGVALSTAGQWEYVRNGQFDSSFTGVALSTRGNWIYVKNGVFDGNFTGIATSSRGNKLYVVRGRWQRNYTGKYNNYNIRNGYVV